MKRIKPPEPGVFITIEVKKRAKMGKIRFANKLIGKGKPCFIIAEAGVNHNGDINLAKKLVDVAKEAGADAVKFQTFKAEEVVIRNAAKAAYQKETTPPEESQYDMLRKLELSKDDFADLFAYAQEQGILFLSSPFDVGSVDLLSELGVSAFKIPSGEITNQPLLKHIARKRKPIILSTGMATREEVGEALEVIKQEGTDDIILLHCVSSYPAKIEDMNLKAMETLENSFQLPVGLSDHSTGITIPIAAVALGACVIEKHFTLDRKLPGPDHRASLEPDELKQMVTAIRDVERAMGNGVKRPTRDEEENKKVVRRSIVAKVDIPQETIITEGMLDIRRPGTGLEPKYLGKIIGRTAEATIKKDEIITISKLRGK
ncbi:N,N'-diacetyllegionaminic acid synthase [subsurface metagenome]